RIIWGRVSAISDTIFPGPAVRSGRLRRPGHFSPRDRQQRRLAPTQATALALAASNTLYGDRANFDQVIDLAWVAVDHAPDCLSAPNELVVLAHFGSGISFLQRGNVFHWIASPFDSLRCCSNKSAKPLSARFLGFLRGEKAGNQSRFRSEATVLP